MPKKDIPQSLVKKVWEILAEGDGLMYFQGLKDEFGEVSPVLPPGHKWNERGDLAPEPIHFTSGMVIRNFMRDLPECKEWDHEDLDNNWKHVVEKALEYTPEQSERLKRLLA